MTGTSAETEKLQGKTAVSWERHILGGLSKFLSSSLSGSLSIAHLSTDLRQ